MLWIVKRQKYKILLDLDFVMVKSNLRFVDIFVHFFSELIVG